MRPTSKNTSRDGPTSAARLQRLLYSPEQKKTFKGRSRAIKSSISFVTKSGGCSEWSTISDNGFVVDLTHYSAIEIDARARIATIRGGVV